MNFWQLSIFVAVIEHQSFSKASSVIHLSQPTVSSHIKDLEAYFDCRLLDRLGKKTEPTRAGRILYEYAKELLHLKAVAESNLVQFLDKTKGELRIGGSTIPSGYIIPRLIGSFLDDHPGIHLRLRTGDTLQIIEKIKSGEVEAGIVGARADDPLICQEKLLADRMKVIVYPDHPLAGRRVIEYSDLIDHRIIGREDGSGTWRSVLSGIRAAEFDAGQLNIILTVGNTNSVIQAILNQVGISILSPLAVQNELDNGRLFAVSIRDLNLKRHFYLTLPAKRSLSPLCDDFITHVRACLSDPV